MNSSRARALLVLVTLALVVWYGVVAAASVSAAVKVRRNPARADFGDLMAGDAPHKVLARYIVLAPGSPIYHNELSQVATFDQLSDRPWNRYLAERFLLAGPVENLRLLLEDYPLTPSDALVSGVVPLLEGGHCDAIPALTRSEFGRARIEAWADAPRKGRSELLVCLPQLVVLDADKFWALLTKHRVSSDELHEALSTFPFEEASESDRLAILTFVTRTVEEGRNPIGAFTEVIGSLIASPDAASGATSLILKHLPEVAVDALPLMLGLSDCDLNDEWGCHPHAVVDDTPGLLTAAFERAKSSSEAGALIFHSLAHSFPQIASTIAVSQCAADDSTLVKSVAVLSARHDISPACLDRAFTGQAPRVALFRSVDAYATGSDAAEQYEMTAGHGFFGVGKRWPPYYGTDEPSSDDAGRWRAFIDKYPWYPAVDDAHYRLTYAMLMAGDPQGAIETIERFEHSEPLDEDSLPFLHHLSLVARVELGDRQAAQEFRESREGLWYWRDAKELPLERAIEKVDWLIRHRGALGPPLPSLEELLVVRRLIEGARAACVGEKPNCQVPSRATDLLGLQLAVPGNLALSVRVMFDARP